jgi:autoinducer 2-degrading protein
MHIVTVTFHIKPEHRDSFREAILANAASSLKTEPGCRVFDVCENETGEIFLYEVYDDVAAFQSHRSTDHFAKFDKASAPWIAEKKIARYELIAKRAL